MVYAMNTTLPSISRQKLFIIENSGILTKDKCKYILDIIISNDESESIIETNISKELSINLDKIKSPIIINQIYEYINSQRHILSQPITASCKLSTPILD